LFYADLQGKSTLTSPLGRIFWFRNKFFAPACRRLGLAPLREKKRVEYASFKGQANPDFYKYKA